MRCAICDSALSKPDYNSELQAYEPCVVCLDVIADTLAGFVDKPSAEEDELGGPDPILSILETEYLSGHFPQDSYQIEDYDSPYYRF